MIISHADLLSCLDTINNLKLTLGLDCRIAFPRYDLELFPSAIEQLLSQPPTPPQVESAPLPPQYVDRTVTMDAAQQSYMADLQSHFLATYQDAPTDYQRRMAFLDFRRAVHAFRLHIIQPIVQADVEGYTALIYGDLVLPGCVSIPLPDGKRYQVDLLVHYSHPCGPEELRLREKRVQCEKILRYRVPGLDDGRWQQQNQQRQPLNAQGWRDLIAQRIELNHGLIRPSEEAVTHHRKVV